jgi:hypothetical protein
MDKGELQTKMKGRARKECAGKTKQAEILVGPQFDSEHIFHGMLEQ